MPVTGTKKKREGVRKLLILKRGDGRSTHLPTPYRARNPFSMAPIISRMAVPIPTMTARLMIE